jgi:hypothetical protein
MAVKILAKRREEEIKITGMPIAILNQEINKLLDLVLKDPNNEELKEKIQMYAKIYNRKTEAKFRDNL